MFLKNHIKITLVLLIFSCVSIAQEYKEKNLTSLKKKLQLIQQKKKNDLDAKCFLQLVDAKSGYSIIGASISIEKIGDFVSDSLGRVYINKPKNGKYKFQFSKEGYISATYDFEIRGWYVTSSHFSMCPVNKNMSMSIVLDWERFPIDLDIHLVKHNGYHITFRNSKVVTEEVAILERDDYNSYGPEMIVLNKIDVEGLYTCYVHDFSHQYEKRTFDLSYSNAVVRVYIGNELVNTYKVPVARSGNKWNVFRIKKGEVETINVISETQKGKD